MSYLYGGNYEKDIDEEYDNEDDEERNDEPPDNIDSDFSNNVQQIKWKIYQNIVFKPQLETREAQDNKLLNEYVNCVRQLYVYTLEAQNGNNNKINLNKFPNEVRDDISKLLNWISDFFRKNQPYQTIPYSDYLSNSFKVYPFVHKKTFDGESFVDME